MPRKIFAFSIVALLLVLLPVATAGTLVFTDKASFLAYLKSGYYLEDFQSIQQGIYTTTMSFSLNGYVYEAYSPNRLCFEATATDSQQTVISPNFANDPLTFSLLSGNVTAVGGYFGEDGFGSQNGTPQVRVQVDDGTFVDINTRGMTQFVGFISTGSPITSLTVHSTIPRPDDGWSWVAADDLYVGTSNVTAQEAVEILAQDIEILLESGTLEQSHANGLMDKLTVISKSIDQGRTLSGCNQLGAFINQVKALFKAGNISSEEGKTLTDTATYIRVQIGC